MTYSILALTRTANRWPDYHKGCSLAPLVFVIRDKEPSTWVLAMKTSVVCGLVVEPPTPITSSPMPLKKTSVMSPGMEPRTAVRVWVAAS